MNYKVLVIGHRGSTGSRYYNILKSLECWPEIQGIKVVGVDLPTKVSSGSFRGMTWVVDASPSRLHYMHANMALEAGIDQKNILLEKPACSTIKTFMALLNRAPYIRVVNNWQYVPGMGAPGTNKIIYQNDPWGPSTYSDKENTFQLLHLAKKKSIELLHGDWMIRVNDHTITKDCIEESYETMLREWLLGSASVWTLYSTAGTHQALWRKN